MDANDKDSPMIKIRNLGLRNDSPLACDAEFVKLVSDLAEEPLVLVKEKIREKYNFTQQKTNEARLAFLRFISLTAYYKGGVVPIPLADVFWHEFILFTSDYAEFCARHFGRFIHHQPRSAGSQVEARSLVDSINLLGINYGSVSHLIKRYEP